MSSDDVPATLVIHKDQQAEWNRCKPPGSPEEQITEMNFLSNYMYNDRPTTTMAGRLRKQSNSINTGIVGSDDGTDRYKDKGKTAIFIQIVLKSSSLLRSCCLDSSRNAPYHPAPFVGRRVA